ncbi:Uncharacterized protein ToN1_10390 [Aromatoleum petrolei]|nr:Uncharacterized protein ToN1_10390 [Aromatoleum petrolei]
MHHGYLSCFCIPDARGTRERRSFSYLGITVTRKQSLTMIEIREETAPIRRKLTIENFYRPVVQKAIGSFQIMAT